MRPVGFESFYQVGPVKSIDHHNFRILLFYLLDFNIYLNQYKIDSLITCKKSRYKKTYIIFSCHKTEVDCNYIIKFLKEGEIKTGI